MDRIEAWRQYELAEARVDRCKAANDLTGLAIAQGQAAHWFAEWKAADELAARTSRTAPTAA